METGALVVAEQPPDSGALSLCDCKSPQCAHCCMYEAQRSGHNSSSSDGVSSRGDYVSNEEEDNLPLEQQSEWQRVGSIAASGQEIVSQAPRKLKLPYRRNSTSSLPSAFEPPLPLCIVSEGSPPPPAEVEADLPTLCLSGDSFLQEREIVSICKSREQLNASQERPSKPLSSPVAMATARKICKFCNREFPSGRALGGHMRVHGGLDSERSQSRVENSDPFAFAHRSSASSANWASKRGSAEVNHKVNISRSLNSLDAGIISRRINSEESLVRGFDDKKPCQDEDLDSICDAGRGISCGRRDSTDRVHEVDQMVIEEKSPSAGPGIASIQEASANAYADGVSKGEDAGMDTHRSKSGRTTTSGLELGRMMSSAISCNVDAAVQAQKRHSQVRLTRRRLWADHEGASCISKRDSSSSQTQNPGSQRPSPPSLSLEEHSEHGGAVEHACLCSECGKAFMSWKALFGHMRCHPERDWRGIQRPELSSFGLENQGRATRRLTFLNAEVKGDADKEPELQSDAEDLEAFELAQGASGISAFGKGDATSMRDRIQEAKLPAHPADIEGAEEKPVDSIKIASSANSAEQNKVNFTVWPRRKRSRRRRASSGFSAKMSSVTSETATSNQQREAEVLDTADQEDLDMANCLVLLSSADGYGDQVNVKDHRRSTDETAFICSTLIDSNQKQGEEFAQALAVDHDDVDDDNNDEDDNDDDDDDDRLGYNNERGTHGTILGSSLNVSSTMRYECSTCRRSFKSHQALGGHRASHRKTKGCFALTNPSTEGSTKEFRRRSTDVDGDDGVSTLELNHWHASMAEHAFLDTPRLYRHKEKEGHQSRLPSSLRTADQRTLAAAKKKFKGHICSICYRVFPSGQALGGHKRCHWTGEKIAESASIASSSNNKVLSQPEQAEWEGAATSISQAEKFLSKEDRIDLNLPAPLDDEDDHAYADDGGLSSSELMRPSAEYISAPVGIDEEDTIEGNLVEYISSKKRSVNQLFAELHGDGAKRVHRNSASAMTSTIESGHGAAQESSNPVQVHIQQCSALGS